MIDDSLLDILTEQRILRNLNQLNSGDNLGLNSLDIELSLLELAAARRRHRLLQSRELGVYTGYLYNKRPGNNPFLLRHMLGR